MNKKNLSLSGAMVNQSYITHSEQALNSRQNLLTALLSNRCLPSEGWDDFTIENLLNELGMMDSNNFVDCASVGEREGKVYSGIVARRNFRFCHGVGRSGVITEAQPKAAGSSLLSKISNFLALDCIRIAGIRNAEACLILPMATGMSLALTLMSMRDTCQPKKTYVLWPRMDQKSCLKAIVTAGFTPIVIPNKLIGHQVEMDLDALKRAIDTYGTENILCVVSTTSCFAPRIPDPVDEIARICALQGIGHVINNAYGLQCSLISTCINKAMAVGRVDAVVQSTDKNFMVPVGGAVVCSPNKSFIENLGQTYPGRASINPVLDLFITLLSMGKNGYMKLISDRENLAIKLSKSLENCAVEYGATFLPCPRNTISFAISLETFRNPSKIGSMLFSRCVTGARVVVPSGSLKTVAGLEFYGYGSSVDGYKFAYLTAACAIGTTEREINLFIARLGKVFKDVRKKELEEGSEVI